MKFNQRCKIRRELLGLSLGDVATKVKLSETTISRFESGVDGMSDFTIQGLRTFYDRLPDELGLTEEEKRYLRIAENAVAVFQEKSVGYRVKYCSSIIIDCGHAIQDETKPKFVKDNNSRR